MTLYVYVDNSNLWIEGMRISAVHKGMASDLDSATRERISDQSWTYDFGRLYQAVCPEGEAVGRSSLFGSRPPKNDSLWKLAEDEGFQVFTFDRNYANKEKQVDVAIATQIVADSFQYMREGDTVVLVSGDRDYLPVIELLHGRGIKTLVAFWTHATGRELKEDVAGFYALDPLFDHLTRAR